MNETCRWSDTEHSPGPIGNSCERGTGLTSRSAFLWFQSDHEAGYCHVSPRTRHTFCTGANSSDGTRSPGGPFGRRALPEPPAFVPALPHQTPVSVGQRPHSTVRAVPSVGIAARPPAEGTQSPVKPLTISVRRLFIRQRRSQSETRKTPLPGGH